MQLWIVLVAAVFSAGETRHYYPYSNYPYTTAPPSNLHKSVNDVTVVDEKTGIQYNPYSKHHPGRHVCSNQQNVTYPTRSKRVFCRPTYKRYMVQCGTQMCEGVRLVYEKYHKEVVVHNNHTVMDFTCCPGWTQITRRSHGCNKPVCSKPCMNGGKCVKPNYCSCPNGFSGSYCEIKLNVYSEVSCVPPCLNGGTCSRQLFCICLSGYTGHHCERDVDECKKYKPCDQICYNTPGSYKCECKEDFVLQKDNQTCRKENDDAFEVTDLEQKKIEKIDVRLQTLEKMIYEEKSKNDITKKDLVNIYNNIHKMSDDINKITDKIQRMVGDRDKF